MILVCVGAYIFLTMISFLLYSGIDDPKRYLAESLGNMARSTPGLLPPRLEALEEQYRNVLFQYLNVYSVQICWDNMSYVHCMGRPKAETFVSFRKYKM